MGDYKWKDPLIPEGKYNFGLVDYSTHLMNGLYPKLYLRFRIMDFGEHYEVVLTKYYGVTRTIGRLGIDGRFQVGPKSNFLREYLTLFPDQQIPRLDRIPMTRFNGVIVCAEVKTVIHGADQRKIPKQLQYSAIKRLIKIVQV